jgi:hypothetical protein
MFRPILIPAIVHGITDIVDAPKQSIFTYALVCPLVYHFPLPVKTGLLLLGSVYHLRNEMEFKNNILMHVLWIQVPIIAQLYLSFIHTPRHFYNSLLLNTYGFKAKVLCIGIMTLVTILDMIFKYSDQHLCPLWWVGPVLSHIYMIDFSRDRLGDYSKMFDNQDTSHNM